MCIRDSLIHEDFAKENNLKLNDVLSLEPVSYTHLFRRFPLDLKVYAYPGAALVIDAEGFGMQYLYESEEILEEAVSSPTSREQVEKHLARLGETVFRCV